MASGMAANPCNPLPVWTNWLRFIGCTCLEPRVIPAYDNVLDEHLPMQSPSDATVHRPTLLVRPARDNCGGNLDVSAKESMDQPKSMPQGLYSARTREGEIRLDVLEDPVAEPKPNDEVHGLTLVDEETESCLLEDARPGETLTSTVALPEQLFNRGSRRTTLEFGQVRSSPAATPSSVTASSRSNCSRTGSRSKTRPRTGYFAEERWPIVTPSIKWRVRIEKKTPNASIGIDVHRLDASMHRDGALLIKDIEVDGLVSPWNATHQSKSVKRGDFVVEINGEHGDPKALIEVLQRDSVLNIMVLRAT